MGPEGEEDPDQIPGGGAWDRGAREADLQHGVKCSKQKQTLHRLEPGPTPDRAQVWGVQSGLPARGTDHLSPRPFRPALAKSPTSPSDGVKVQQVSGWPVECDGSTAETCFLLLLCISRSDCSLPQPHRLKAEV
ncbi:hypothetical protein AAFF_G00046270 [Aldrovandia affinis]|uniref:Uncharacterized protein n=1 Tax=Aldrovandia affinis TaxID=143900 RepID=A0AAD7S425_9TELE|nr:hypothetical protein AAFF_G00046270 [Aldrovandia affinis]